MNKRVLLIGSQKSFMMSAIARGLENARYQVIKCELSKSDIEAVENKPELYVLYLGEIDPSSPEKNGIEPLKYLDEAIDRERFYLYEVGNTDELEYAARFLSKIKVTETFLRPLDVNQLTEQLDMVVQSNAYGDEKKKKVLIVDDDGTVLRMIKTWLSVKYRVYMASSGKMALTFLQTNDVDLVLLDYMMPQMDGPQVLLEIRKDDRLKELPVMFLTSKSDKESVVSVAALKPAKYLLKTMPKAKLLKSIDVFFDEKK